MLARTGSRATVLSHNEDLDNAISRNAFAVDWTKEIKVTQVAQALTWERIQTWPRCKGYQPLRISKVTDNLFSISNRAQKLVLIYQISVESDGPHSGRSARCVSHSLRYLSSKALFKLCTTTLSTDSHECGSSREIMLCFNSTSYMIQRSIFNVQTPLGIFLSHVVRALPC